MTLVHLEVNISSVADGNLVQYNSSTGQWENVSIANLDSTWSTWSPTLLTIGGMNVVGASVNHARYIQVGKTVNFSVRFSMELTGSGERELLFGLPVNAAGTYRGSGCGYYYSGGGDFSVVGWPTAADAWSIFKTDFSNYAIAAGQAVMISGMYERA